MTESKQATHAQLKAALVYSNRENERLRAEVEGLKQTRATLMGEAVKAGIQLAELREAALEAITALKHEAKAIGAAQTSEDIDWFMFGEATVLKTYALSALEDCAALQTSEGGK